MEMKIFQSFVQMKVNLYMKQHFMDLIKLMSEDISSWLFNNICKTNILCIQKRNEKWLLSINRRARRSGKLAGMTFLRPAPVPA